MSFRNPYITGFLYNAAEAAKVKEALSSIWDCNAHGNHVLYGICKCGSSGAMPTEEVMQLEAALTKVGAAPDLDIFVAGEMKDDQVLLHWDGNIIQVFPVHDGNDPF
jgi:hypothetical protein